MLHWETSNVITWKLLLIHIWLYCKFLGIHVWRSVSIVIQILLMGKRPALFTLVYDISHLRILVLIIELSHHLRIVSIVLRRVLCTSQLLGILDVVLSKLWIWHIAVKVVIGRRWNQIDCLIENSLPTCCRFIHIRHRGPYTHFSFNLEMTQ